MDNENRAERAMSRIKRSIDPDDPVYQIVEIFEAQQAEAMEGLGRMIAKAADDIAATVVMAENSARIKSQAIATNAVKLGANKIHLAGVDAANAVSQRVEIALDRAETAAKIATRAAWFSGVAAGGAVLAVLILAVLIFQ